MDWQLLGIKIMLMKCIKKFGLPCIISLRQTKIHGNCPAGANGWCSYHRGKAEGMDVSKFKHDYLPLDKDVTKALEPIY